MLWFIDYLKAKRNAQYTNKTVYITPAGEDSIIRFFCCLTLAIAVPAAIIVEKHETNKYYKQISSKAHEQVAAAVDTIKYNDIVIDTKIAREDSVRTAKQLRKAIKKDDMYNKPYLVYQSPEYRRYCEAIKKLEIARRQQKIKG